MGTFTISENHEKLAYGFYQCFGELGHIREGLRFSSKSKLSRVDFGVCSIREFHKSSQLRTILMF